MIFGVLNSGRTPKCAIIPIVHTGGFIPPVTSKESLANFLRNIIVVFAM